MPYLIQIRSEASQIKHAKRRMEGLTLFTHYAFISCTSYNKTAGGVFTQYENNREVS